MDPDSGSSGVRAISRDGYELSAATPREGTPVEIQGAVISLLRQLARLGSHSNEPLGRTRRKGAVSLDDSFAGRARLPRDLLIAKRGQPPPRGG